MSEESPKEAPKKKRVGLAAASLETRLRVAQMGGRTISQNREHMRSIGVKGGSTLSQNKDHMSRIGSVGGKAVAKDLIRLAAIAAKGRQTQAKRRLENPKPPKPPKPVKPPVIEPTPAPRPNALVKRINGKYYAQSPDGQWKEIRMLADKFSGRIK